MEKPFKATDEITVIPGYLEIPHEGFMTMLTTRGTSRRLWRSLRRPDSLRMPSAP